MLSDSEHGVTQSYSVFTVVFTFSGLAEWEVLTGAAGEQVRGGGVCDGAADSHGEYS